MVDMSFVALLFSAATGAVTFGPEGHFQLEQSRDSFGIRSHGIIEKLGSNRTKFYPLPQSTADEYIRFRPEDLRINSSTRNTSDRRSSGLTRLRTAGSGSASSFTTAKA